MTDYIVATIKDWNIQAFHDHVKLLPGQWHLMMAKEELTAAAIDKIKPRYIFFPHWSWVVPQEILDRTECVCFHMTDVPYGRGGSPLQNLIARGHKDTKLTALRMEAGLDTGPVYYKLPLSLEGRAQEIYELAGKLVYELIARIVKEEPEPAPQQGEPVIFTRRTPDMSILPEKASPQALYDHIRMLDAESYPRAFVEHGDFILTFSHPVLQKDGTITAQTQITKKS